MTKLLLALFLILLSTSSAIAKDWKLSSGSLQYTLTHALHTTVGTSKEVKGLGKCEANSCRFLIAAPVKSFDSANANRDSNMQQYTKAALFPIVEVRTTVLPVVGKKSADLEVKFAGKTHKYSVQMEFTKENSGFKVNTNIPMKLSDFSIERPALFGVNVSDEVPISVELHIAAN